MKYNQHNNSILPLFIILALFLFQCFSATAQAPWTPDAWGTSDTTVRYDYGIYEWPQSPCPEVQIKQKHDHTPLKQYRAQGWDTVVNCTNRQLTLSCIPYIPVQYFNGQYTVDPIPYDPPDPTFAYGLQGTSTKMPVATDDDFAASPTAIPFDFFFFGVKKTAFVLGANGLITFDTTAAGRYCPWKYSASVPWPDSKSGIPYGMGCTKDNMRDAIYGIYEDTHPVASYLHGDQGIYYGIQGEEPCRKIIASWNGIPTFPGSRNRNNRCTYQIVCYEGSNIIEVHVKHRGTNSDWQEGHGLLAVQNATGEPQVSGGTNTTMFVRSGAPAAYFPEGYNLLTDSVDSVAFRFTPQGTTQKPYEWYRILDTYHYDTVDGQVIQVNDTVHLSKYTAATPEAAEDTNGYYYPLGSSAGQPLLTRAMVRPSRVSRYVFHLRFADASNHWYYLYDTIVVGIDTANAITLRPSNGSADEHETDICSGQEARLTLEFPELEDTAEVHYTLTRINGGQNIPLPDSLLTFGQRYVDEQTKDNRIPLILRPDATALNLQPGEIDSINIQFVVDFVSGCNNSVNFLLRTHPSYDVVEDTGICQGDVFHWDRDGNNYTQATTSPQVNVGTVFGCDSIVHLHLEVSDVSYTIDEVHACKPILWHNHTYYETNTATAATDTAHLLNIWGCDSTVQLAFTLTPMTPIIDASLDYFDFNNLEVTLTDVSTGGNGRTWYFPTGEPQEGPTAYYVAPYNIDSAVIMMVEYSPYGCIDTATVTIPFRRDVIWVPNVITPDIPDGGNDRFHSVSTHVLKEQTLIYNRYGELIFRCDEVDCAWDGTYANGNPCPQGTYTYLIRYSTEYDPHTTHVLKGTVTLIR